MAVQQAAQRAADATEGARVWRSGLEELHADVQVPVIGGIVEKRAVGERTPGPCLEERRAPGSLCGSPSPGPARAHLEITLRRAGEPTRVVGPAPWRSCGEAFDRGWVVSDGLEVRHFAREFRGAAQRARSEAPVRRDDPAYAVASPTQRSAHLSRLPPRACRGSDLGGRAAEAYRDPGSSSPWVLVVERSGESQPIDGPGARPRANVIDECRKTGASHRPHRRRHARSVKRGGRSVASTGSSVARAPRRARDRRRERPRRNPRWVGRGQPRRGRPASPIAPRTSRRT